MDVVVDSNEQRRDPNPSSPEEGQCRCSLQNLGNQRRSHLRGRQCNHHPTGGGDGPRKINRERACQRGFNPPTTRYTRICRSSHYLAEVIGVLGAERDDPMLTKLSLSDEMGTQHHEKRPPRRDQAHPQPNDYVNGLACLLSGIERAQTEDEKDMREEYEEETRR